MKELLIKALVSGGVSGVASNMLYGDGIVTLFGNSLSASVATGVAVGAGSLVSDYLSESIIENMELPQNIKSIEEHAIRAGVCGASSSAVMLFNGMPISNVAPAFILGAGSKLGGDVAYDKLFGSKGFIGPLF